MNGAMNGIAQLQPSTRTRLISAAGVVIILLSAGAALLPIAEGAPFVAIGTLLIIAGLIEVAAGLLRRDGGAFAIAAGAVTTLAGLLFLINRTSQFFPTINLVAAWLLLRSLVLLVATIRAGGPVKTWIGISAATDFLLGLLLVAGLSISGLVVSVFGPTPQLIASFAWVFALSFIITGTLLLQVASCERDSAD
jgi:hypothetical protein